MVFSIERRQQVSDRLLQRARSDERVIGAARTGSAARGVQDRWSDIDLFFGVTENALAVAVESAGGKVRWFGDLVSQGCAALRSNQTSPDAIAHCCSFGRDPAVADSSR